MIRLQKCIKLYSFCQISCLVLLKFPAIPRKFHGNFLVVASFWLRKTKKSLIIIARCPIIVRHHCFWLSFFCRGQTWKKLIDSRKRGLLLDRNYFCLQTRSFKTFVIRFKIFSCIFHATFKFLHYFRSLNLQIGCERLFNMCSFDQLPTTAFAQICQNLDNLQDISNLQVCIILWLEFFKI